MRSLKLTLLVLMLGGSALAQDVVKPTSKPDVDVLKISWRRVEAGDPRLIDTRSNASPDTAQRMAVNTARMNEYKSARDNGASPPPPVMLSVPTATELPRPVRPFSGFIYEFIVKNTGSKTIKQVAFEYSFLDPGTQRTVARRNYKSKVKIRPGMTAKIVVRSTRKPIGTIDARNVRDPQEQSPEQMVIQSIKYSDGSVWQRESN